MKPLTDPIVLALIGAMFAIGGLRGAFPHWREHRRIRKDERKHRRRLWESMRDRGYDVMPWPVARKTGLLVQDNEWNQLRAQLEEQDREHDRHGT